MIDASRAFGRAAGLVAALTAPILLAGCDTQLGLLGAAGPVAEAQKDHLWSIFLWMLLVSIPIYVAVPLILWRYRLGGRGAYRPRWEYSLVIETLIWAVPVIVVSVLGWNLWRETLEQDPYRPLPGPAPLDIQVIGYDWKWLFVYPEQGVATVNDMVIPEGRPVRLTLTTATVMQSFMVPRLAGQIYAMPAMTTQLNLVAPQAGDYRGLNTQYNGEGFARQSFATRALAAEDFDAWAEGLKNTAPPLDRAAMEALAARDVPDGPISYGSVAGDPFREIVMGGMIHGTAPNKPMPPVDPHAGHHGHGAAPSSQSETTE